ncbi:MAG TPA: LptA/OstA family protein [Steroidobacteraceae bacterium]|nr:LptA/OstA family protein [Steroidobacteraceae bacterium]
MVIWRASIAPGAAAVLVLGVPLMALAAQPATVPQSKPAAAASQLDALTRSIKSANPEWTASHSEIQPNHVVLEDFELTQGDLHLKSDHAEAAGIDFQNSTWTFTGHVVITLPMGELTSDTATVKFAAGQAQLATASGDPAHFNATIAATGKNPARNTSGRAQQVEYDLQHQQLRFLGDAWFSDGGNELSAPKVTYDLATRGYSADAPEGQRVHGLIKSTRSSTP